VTAAGMRSRPVPRTRTRSCASGRRMVIRDALGLRGEPRQDRCGELVLAGTCRAVVAVLVCQIPRRRHLVAGHSERRDPGRPECHIGSGAAMAIGTSFVFPTVSLPGGDLPLPSRGGVEATVPGSARSVSGRTLRTQARVTLKLTNRQPDGVFPFTVLPGSSYGGTR